MVHIAISSDGNYVKQCYTLIKSACMKSSIPICFHLISNGIDEGDLNKIEEIVRQYDGTIKVYPFDMILNRLNTDGKYNLSSYARLFLPDLLENDINKILYCDCDALFFDDPCLIYEENIEGFLCAGVLDTVDFLYKDKISMSASDPYVNAGMVLFNLVEMRQDHTVDRFIECIKKYNGSVPHHDQGVINSVCNGRIKVLRPNCNVLCTIFEFNVEQIQQLYHIKYYYTEEEIENAKVNPIFVHYTAAYYNRPWNKNCTHPLKQQFLDVYNTIPFNTELKNHDLKFKVKFLRFVKNHTTFGIYKSVCRCMQFRKRMKFSVAERINKV